MKVISMAPLKGGTSKTTTSFQILGWNAMNNKKCLAIGLDAQCNLSNFLRKEKSDNDIDIYDVLIDGYEIKKAIKNSRFDNIDYIPDSKRLGQKGVHVEKLAIKDALEYIENDYDLVVIDNSPTLTSGAISSLVASTDTIITAELDDLNLENLVGLINEHVSLNSNANIYITPSRAEINTTLYKDIRKELENFVDGVDYLHLTHGIPNSSEMKKSIRNRKILIQEKAIRPAHIKLKKALEKLAKEVSA